MLILLGIVCGLFGVLYNKSTMKVQALFAKSGLQHYGVMVAMLLSGVLALCLSDVLGSGHAMIEMLSENPVMMLRTLFLLLAVKFAFSLISFGSGAPGGIFFPAACPWQLYWGNFREYRRTGVRLLCRLYE